MRSRHQASGDCKPSFGIHEFVGMQGSVLAELTAVQQPQTTFAVDRAVQRLLVGVAAFILEIL